MGVYITGDIHGDPIERFSFSKHPELKELTKDDVIFILGDFGVIWNKDNPTPEEKYIMEWLNDKPWTTIAITGNHENYDRIMAMPITTVFGGTVRDTGYDSVYIAPDATIFDIGGQHILCLPRAESHDVYKVSEDGDWLGLGTGYSNLIDPLKDEDGSKRSKMRDMGLFYRVIGESWWPQEKIPVEEYMDFMEGHESEHFDLVLSHEAPSCINRWFAGGAENGCSNEGQRYFDMLARTLDYEAWFHGHFHFDGLWPSNEESISDDDYLYAPYEWKMCGIYKSIGLVE